MNYNQTLEFLFSSLASYQEKGPEAYKPGLERITAFCKQLGNPQRNFYTIHIAGTNGKGSVSHILAAVLQQAGYRTGLYTSPHLNDFRERILVDGEMIPKQKVVNFVDKHHATMTELGLSFFEMTTALAFDYFAQSDVEVAVIETGLGGRLDATNIIVPILSVVTNIGMDHMALLGDTLPKIAAEKAGIIKKSVPVVIGEMDDRYNHVFEQAASEKMSKIVYAENEFTCINHSMGTDKQCFSVQRNRDNKIFHLDLDLMGNYQIHNVITAVTAIDLLHQETPLTISVRALREGMSSAASSTALKGRWQKLAEHPLTICDTGHNAHGIKYVVEQLAQTPHKTLFCILGFVNDKDISAVLPLFPKEARYLFTQPSNERALPAATLAEKAKEFGLDGEVIDTVAGALARARELACEEDMIFIGGSNFVVAEVVE
ncbi:folylpolyglutamate synthase/dihydrofolate synthase family protein [uncultured Alistipes sp.]|uniref:bifunctional folylpolyglutamate synthase/dihydrofolate synthase n=1 Tax=uncultured Alistipes sp. TaxID=538949 RepID=UPI00262AB7E7|nr:folylpolyglutamate synthase/dihydrofolate synthase family protein [uncultured Alistipes sp.]